VTLRPLPILLLLLSLLVPAGQPAQASDAAFRLSGKILDDAGNPVKGCEVFVYDSPRTRRAADFISPRSDAAGRYLVEIPAGKYWLVARLRDAAANGPFAGVQKHSGEATELDATAGTEETVDFTVAEVRALARRQRRPADEFLKVEGRVLDGAGNPLPHAYVYALKDGNVSGLPDYLSYLTEEDGLYVLQLPPGSYCLGGATSFPPETGSECRKELLENATIGVAIDVQLKYPRGPEKAGAAEKSGTDD
jgi:hypothetical protein